MRVEVRRGDIADQPDLDAVVNAANTELWMGAGVAGALKRRGGAAIEREAMAKGPIAMGDAVVTGAGALPNARVVHVAALGFRPGDGPPTAAVIERGTARALALCVAEGIRSIGFPALGTGVGGFPIEACAEAMCRAVAAHEGALPERVAFVVRDEAAGRAFARAAQSQKLDAGS